MKILIAIPAKASKEEAIPIGLSYLDRLRLPLSAQASFLSPRKNIDERNKKKRIELESEDLMRASDRYFRIALTQDGQPYSSEGFADLITGLSHRTPRVAFLIGGAFGLSPGLIRSCDSLLSLSRMTLPHRLAFLVLCEQLYRASEMINHTPYHK